ncbi:hypothetical protein KGF57_001631 [Candida theae]|uniref:Extracellular membrane protein CFEM domain-containing protein n=1 Tax=Candida theae TaxID=1198502 RepID=A0AAD5BGL9_9ASCO|nr:uncharacterized protein KGF57_001631 [Candida theae]KAI5961697.1 hypothetical protein KGF57_001631 [Candida theae]
MPLAITNISFLILVLIQNVCSIPPACFLSCAAEVSRTCERGLSQMTCVCLKEDQIVGCLIDICPFGNFNSARDHFLGTCLEHGKPTVTNPYPPPAAWPPSDYEKNLPKMHESVYRPEPTRGHLDGTIANPGLDPAEGIVDNHNPTVSPPTQPSSSIQQTPNEIPVHHRPDRNPLQQNSPWRAPQAPEQQHPRTEGEYDAPTRSTAQPKPDFVDPWFDGYDEDFTGSYDPERPIEWEEMDVLDPFGRFAVVRRPINVPKSSRDPSNVGKRRRVVVKPPVGQVQHKQSLVQESRKLVEKSIINGGLFHESSLQGHLTASVSHKISPSVSLHSTVSTHQSDRSTPSVTKIARKRGSKTNRKTSPF